MHAHLHQLSTFCFSLEIHPFVLCFMILERDPVNICPLPVGRKLCLLVEGSWGNSIRGRSSLLVSGATYNFFSHRPQLPVVWRTFCDTHISASFTSFPKESSLVRFASSWSGIFSVSFNGSPADDFTLATHGLHPSTWYHPVVSAYPL